MDMVRASCIVATDHSIPAYGGMRLAREALDQIAHAVASKSIPMLIAHDDSRPIHVENVTAGVRARDDGHFEVWAEFDADEAAWMSYERDRVAAGAPGGMSIGFHVPYGSFENSDGRRPRIRIAADAHHFSQDDLVTAGTALAPVLDVDVDELYQLAGEPPVKVVIEYGLALLESVPANLLGALVWESLRHFVAKARRTGRETILTFRINESENGREVAATVETSSDEVAIAAIERLADLAESDGRFIWSGDGAWKDVRENHDETESD